MSSGSISPGKACPRENLVEQRRLRLRPARVAMRSIERSEASVLTQPGTDRVDGDAARAQFFGPGFGQPDDGMLGGDIGAEQRFRGARPHRGRIDDAAAARQRSVRAARVIEERCPRR